MFMIVQYDIESTLGTVYIRVNNHFLVLNIVHVQGEKCIL